MKSNLIVLNHKGRKVTTTVGSTLHENYLAALQSLPFGEGFVPAGYAHRPDLISNLFFNGVGAWTTVMEINGLFDPFESLKLSDRVRLPL